MKIWFVYKTTNNISGGGRFEYQTKEESRQKMRKPKSPEHRAAISAGKLGKKLSDSHKAAVSAGRLGLVHSEETKLKMSNTRSNNIHETVECPHCGKTGGAPAIGQWHFNNCKHRSE
ncbi:putative homing endonuclease [Pseudomonas phage vB_PsyM_KIL3b]|uniref:Putative homing endonuclease n=3 Tax=Pseudomonas phage vB_PsyM_KIL1 TaxID=1777065 RepID=A0A142IFX7_9CAUD|nr:putative homing endonuclease [Pseudomonas phage vB_PsyM_KIL1]AMR57313.1 putative homing endonuclease [Pseudomonas phage vB_PsyM_KIL1]AMR57634.1 putative homing endonuclease [Pseudomonas phage vB_PsyM_KIL3]AMR58132.1 putative homing endonuclease [Pseudomonas phage vB_PsyM_KIL3b]